jgi:malonate-semialdehyde dehydrogenase (acetylating)/methylmalonate-semialdehyde dehydrogenase
MSATAPTGTRVGHWIGGETVVGRGERSLPIEDPALGHEVRSVELADAVLVADAVEAAAAAALDWGERPLAGRTAILRAWSELISAHGDEFIAVMGEEQGKVQADARGELMRGLETLDVACAAGLLLKGEISPQIATGVDAFSMRMPLGVCAAITPFNFPFMAPLYLSSIALACGNAMILKPSERVPSASLLLARLAAEAGLPAGVLNVVQGDRVAVDAILDHPGIAAVSFIGSTPVAKHVHARGSAAGKRVQAFGGAKNHMVVMPDADLEFTADAAVSAAFGSSGQRCMAVSVVVAVGGVGDDLVAAIGERMASVRVGPATDADAEMGPLISKAAQERVLGAIDEAEAAGATVAVDGRGKQPAAGFFVAPTLLDYVTPDLEVYRREVFGPVLSVVRVDTLDRALALIDGSQFGNGAAIFTRDGGAARRFQRLASAGMIGINVPIPIPNAVYSFGGWKDSRFGDQHMAGTEGFRFYTKQKVVTSRWPESKQTKTSLAFPAR